MNLSDTDKVLRSRIEEFVDELAGIIREAALASVQEALAGDAPARRGPGRPRKAGRRGPGRPPKAGRRGPGRPRKAGKRLRRSSADLEAISTKVLGHIKANPGQRLEEIGKALGTATKILKRPIAKLLSGKALRTEGQRRGTKYFAGGKKGKGKK